MRSHTTAPCPLPPQRRRSRTRSSLGLRRTAGRSAIRCISTAPRPSRSRPRTCTGPSTGGWYVTDKTLSLLWSESVASRDKQTVRTSQFLNTGDHGTDELENDRVDKSNAAVRNLPNYFKMRLCLSFARETPNITTYPSQPSEHKKAIRNQTKTVNPFT